MPFQKQPVDPNDPPRPDRDKAVGAIAHGMNPRSVDRTAIALPAGAKARLCEEAIRRGCTVSNLIRVALAEYLDWPEIIEAGLPGRPLDMAKDGIRKEKRERVRIPLCVNVPKRKHIKGIKPGD